MNYGLKQEWVFTPHNDCPSEIRNELRKLWIDRGLMNGDYIGWECLEDRDEDDNFAQLCPLLDKYFIENNIPSCLIYWGW